MSHRANIVEFGGWALLAAAIAWLLYVLFSRTAVVTAKVGGVPVGAAVDGHPVPPDFTPQFPDRPATYTDKAGYMWLWDMGGKQWYMAAVPQEVPPQTRENVV